MKKKNILAILLVFLTTTFSLIFFQDANASSESSVQSVIIFDKQVKSRSHAKLPPTVFRHDQHEDLYKCSVCHPELFAAKIGSNTITMMDQMEGGYCGKCHDGMISFGMSDCALCHRKK